MTIQIGMDQWIYVVVEKSPNTEQIIAQHDTENDICFIPTFLNRETAQQNTGRMPINGTYEIQAIIYEDLLKYANGNQCLIFLLDERGAILLKITPDGHSL